MNSTRLKIAVIYLIAVLCLWDQGYALESDKDQPMHLEADSLSVDEASGVVLYEGNVEITQGSLKIWADKLWIRRHQGKTQRLIGVGEPVRFRQLPDKGAGEVHGQARRVEINAQRDELLLIDDALLEQGGNRFHSDRILYNREKAVVRAGASAQGKKRVQVVIEPRKQE
jgi:lipopolysaccharide export system protein LptA